MKDAVRANLDNEFSFSDGYKPNKADWLDGRWSGITRPDSDDWRGNTGVAIETLKDIGHRVTTIPNDFHIHKTVGKLVERRREMIDTGQGIDWAMAEHMAFASLLMEGFRVRLSGQDCERGTFSQRHAVFIDQQNERRFSPLKHLSPNQARFEIVNSMLSEEAVLGFEYGYSLAEPNALTLWEAQFGDFANGAQVIFDQFLSSGERKWLRMSGLVCLLPHGYEGQGPEHSSARLERYLQLSAEDNWQVANCSTPANYFHILRRQLHRNFRKPLILMTPKSLLRHKRVVLENRGLRPQRQLPPAALGRRRAWLFDDQAETRQRDQARRDLHRQGLLRPSRCSRFQGSRRRLHPSASSSSIRSRRAPSSKSLGASSSRKSSGARRSPRIWAPGTSWTRISSGFLNHLGYIHRRPRYAGRAASAATATGLLSQHIKEQTALVADALGV